jgi:hypothetical protein
MISPGPELGFAAALLAGLAGSGHCLAMCGGISAALAGASRAPAPLTALLLSTGRVLSYSLAGALAGGGGALLGRGLDLLRLGLGLRIVFGALWGWLPCGLVYSMLALALASGSPGNGALVMAGFGLGTLPAILLAGGTAAGLLRHLRGSRGRRLSGALLAGFGLWTIVGALPHDDHAAHAPVTGQTAVPIPGHHHGTD